MSCIVAYKTILCSHGENGTLQMMPGETFPQISGPGWRRVTTKRRLEGQLVNTVDMEDEVDMVGFMVRKEQVDQNPQSLFSLGRSKLIKFCRYKPLTFIILY